MITQLFAIAGILLLLLLWRLLWRTQPVLLPVGIGFGVLAGWIIVTVVKAPELKDIPLWLPPLPFAAIAITLFVFGIMAWLWGDDRNNDDRHNTSDQRPQQH